MTLRTRVRRAVVLTILVIGLLSGCASAPRRGAVSIPDGWPVNPKVASISSPFGARRGGSGHQGIDLSAPRGTPVWAAADGKVVVAEREGAFGRTVVIDHGNGYTTRYAHLKRIKVEHGRRVKRGDVIGTVGASGNASGPHLHYEVLRDGAPVDPRPYLGGE